MTKACVTKHQQPAAVPPLPPSTFPPYLCFCSGLAVPLPITTSINHPSSIQRKRWTPLAPTPIGRTPRACASPPGSQPPTNTPSSSHEDKSLSTFLQPPSPSRRRFLFSLLTAFPLLSTSAFSDTLPDPTSSTLIEPPAKPPPPPPPPPPPSPPVTKTPKWSYTAPTGPATWGDLSADYIAASTGVNQSPIALSYRSALPPPPPSGSTSSIKRPVLTSTPSTYNFKLKDIPAAQNPSLVLDLYIPPPPPVVGDAPPLDLPAPPPPPAFIKFDSTAYAFRAMHVHAGSSEHVIDKVVGAAEFHFVFERRPRVAPPPTPSVPVTPPAPAASTTAPSSSPPSSDSSKISTASASTTISQRTSSVTTSEQLSSNLSPNLSSSSTSPLFQSSLSSALSSSLMGLVPPANAEENTGTISSSTDRPTTQTLVVAILAKRADESAEWISNLLKPFLAKAGADGRGPGILLDMDIATTMLAEFDSTDLFVYNGSLTTPPCTEGVTWVVLRSKCGIAPEDVDTITRLQKGVNVRPLQPTNDRRVIRFPRVPLSS